MHPLARALMDTDIFSEDFTRADPEDFVTAHIVLASSSERFILVEEFNNNDYRRLFFVWDGSLRPASSLEDALLRAIDDKEPFRDDACIFILCKDSANSFREGVRIST